MNIAIKPVAAHQIRALAERYPDLAPSHLAKKGGWPLSQVQSALRQKTPDRPKSRRAS